MMPDVEFLLCWEYIRGVNGMDYVISEVRSQECQYNNPECEAHHSRLRQVTRKQDDNKQDSSIRDDYSL